MLAGGFDAQSQRWDPRCTERRRAAYWGEIIDEHGLVIGNDDRPTHYWMRNECEGASIVDLSLANRPFGKWTIVDGDQAMGSDREIIEWEIEVENEEEAAGTQVVWWKLAATWEEEDTEHAEKLSMERARGRVKVGAESTGDDVESEPEWCQDALRKVLDATAKKKRICARSKRWWNGEITERRSQLGRERRRRYRSAATAQGKAELPKSIRRAKDRM